MFSPIDRRGLSRGISREGRGVAKSDVEFRLSRTIHNGRSSKIRSHAWTVPRTMGASVPVQHRASRQATYNRPVNDLFRLIGTPTDFPTWRTSVTSVEMLPERNGHPRYQESGKDGSILYEVERIVPDKMLVTRIADRSLHFGGTWTYTVIPDRDSTTSKLLRMERFTTLSFALSPAS
jgi:uncharacterized protein YndB with AHSA1/START domain